MKTPDLQREEIALRGLYMTIGALIGSAAQHISTQIGSTMNTAGAAFTLLFALAGFRVALHFDSLIRGDDQ